MFVTNPQPISYTAGQLQRLDRFKRENRNCLVILAGSEIMLVGATFRMVADTLRFTAHAMRDCWQNRTITSLALNSLSQAIRHLVLAVIMVSQQIFFPHLLVELLGVEMPLLCVLAIASVAINGPSYISRIAERMKIGPADSWANVKSKMHTAIQIADTAFIYSTAYYFIFAVPALDEANKAQVLASTKYRVLSATACILCLARTGVLRRLFRSGQQRSAFTV